MVDNHRRAGGHITGTAASKMEGKWNSLFYKTTERSGCARVDEVDGNVGHAGEAAVANHCAGDLTSNDAALAVAQTSSRGKK